MPVYRREVRVDAPLSVVWDFHSRTDGLEALTPEFLHLRVESVTGPDDDPNPDALAEGSRIVSSIQPFGVGPRQRWTSLIVEREAGEEHAMFRDVMADGPFRSWEHTHSFFADGDQTIVRDRVAYELPMGPVGRALGPFAVVGLEPMFRYRHRRTRELLEGRTTQRTDSS